MARFIHSGGIVNHQNKMTEIVNPVIGTSTQEALAVALAHWVLWVQLVLT